MQGQPIQILEMLLAKPGQLVTREEIQARLWPADTFVDFDHSLNTAVKKLRQALSDEVDAPRYIETLPKRGYRFIGKVEPPSQEDSAVELVAPPENKATAPSNRTRRTQRGSFLAACAVAFLAGVGVLIQLQLAWFHHTDVVFSRSEGSVPYDELERHVHSHAGRLPEYRGKRNQQSECCCTANLVVFITPPGAALRKFACRPDSASTTQNLQCTRRDSYMD